MLYSFCVISVNNRVDLSRRGFSPNRSSIRLDALRKASFPELFYNTFSIYPKPIMTTHPKLYDEYQIARERMIKLLREHYKIRDERVLAAMLEIPRHFFVPEALKSQAYKDNALPIASKQTISQPFIVARMTELLELKPQSKVLEIGAGSGYQTAILAKLAGQIYAVERVPILVTEAMEKLQKFNVKNVVLTCADGTLGWQTYAPFDAILVAAGSPAIPQPLLSQLRIGGRLVLPVGADQKTQKLIRVTRTERDFKIEDFGTCAFVPLIGEHGWA